METSTFHYPPEEFEKNFFDIQRLIDAQPQSSTASEIALRYFEKSGGPFWRRKCELFCDIMAYMDTNRSEFDEGKIGVIGKKQAMVSKQIFLAVYFFYVTATPEQLNHPPSPDEIKQMVRQKMERNKNMGK